MDLTADAGLYDPLFLGEDILLDGCGSTFDDAFICELQDISRFTATWLLDDVVLGDGFELLVATGPSTLFNRPGDFLVTLKITFDGIVPLTDDDVAIITLLIRDVPLPASLPLLLIGLLGIAWTRRRTSQS